jgi:hypothetical protein
MFGGGDREVRWLRRPRRPARGLLSTALFWVLVAFWLVVAFLVGLGVVLTEETWWAQVFGGLVSLTCVAAALWLVAYFRRPADRRPRDAGMGGGSADASYATNLERHGCAEIRLRRSAVAKTSAQALCMVLIGAASVFYLGGPIGVAGGILILGMAVFLGVLPHVELLTAGRPAVRVDAHGIRIARWTPLTIPWSEVVSVRAHEGSATQANVVIHVRDAFFSGYLAARPLPLRLSDRLLTVFTGQGFTIPSTVAATPSTLAAWLDGEARRRQLESALPPDR